mmetsp:Transcript_2210/g.5116  ORF Transcript_2210/g.5116 Transcript_2210/m.5116 type:complete len:86 (-) Transcript_2210:78-335(-)
MGKCKTMMSYYFYFLCSYLREKQFCRDVNKKWAKSNKCLGRALKLCNHCHMNSHITYCTSSFLCAGKISNDDNIVVQMKYISIKN